MEGAELGCVGRPRFLGARGFALPMIPMLSLLAVAAEPQVQFNPHTVRLPVVDGKGLRFTHISTVDGLSHTRATHIVQDDQMSRCFPSPHG